MQGTGIRAGRRPRFLVLAGLCAAASGLVAGAATAEAASWSCRGSALSASLAGNPAAEPLVANSGFTPCVTGAAGPQNVGAVAGVPANGITAVTASANTTIAPPNAAPAAQTIAAVARVEGLSVQLPPGGGLTLGVRAATARVAGACINGIPTLTGSSEAVGLSINGSELPLQQALTQLAAALAPLGQVVDLRVGEQVHGDGTLTQRALHLRLLTAGGAQVLDLIAGEARGGHAGTVCQDTGTVTGPAGGDRGGTGLPAGARPCPLGSVLDAASGFCVIRVASGGVRGERIIRVGRPFEGPSGGTVVALEQARKRYRSACLSGRGPQFAIVGTNKADRITGTNKADRILLLGGADRGDGGRGADCLDGGAGRDVLSGAQERDRVYGNAGNDSLNGGPAADSLSGGTGSDTINGAFGADRVTGGPGRDAINVATAGPRARVNCGGGRDTLRLNASERRSARSCERTFVLPDKRLKRRR